MFNRSENIGENAIAGLHPFSLTNKEEILRLFTQAQLSGTQFSRGLNHRVDLEIAHITSLTDEEISFSTTGFRRNARNQIFLNFEANGRPYFFSAEATGGFEGNILRISFPTSIYCTERRDRKRRNPRSSANDIELFVDGGASVAARIEDISPGGLGISVPTTTWNRDWSLLRLRYTDEYDSRRETHASVRSQSEDKDGWVRIGLAESSERFRGPIEPEVWNTLDLDVESLKKAEPAEPETRTNAQSTQLVQFADSEGHEIVGFLDQYQNGEKKTCVVLHTGWGETKETLLPIAQTILETFKAHQESVSVLRIDGVNQRGESYKNPDARVQGREYNRFAFSQGIRDLDASVDFMRARFSPHQTILISQSVAALSARKFISTDKGKRVNAWVSIVGSPDLQSMSRSISGGIDFALGHENGILFGYQELLGIVVHADRLLHDAVEIGVLHIEDARQDFAKIDIPVTWFHGRFDAWVNFDRVRDAFSYGPRENRRLISIPTAHRLGWSTGASDTFLSVATEVARLATGLRLEPVRPDRDSLMKRRAQERKRRPKLNTNLRAFWRDYLIGRDGSVGIELMTACDPYRSLMCDQIEMLRLEANERVLDLGCGTGSLATGLATARPAVACQVKVIGLDHVPEALKRARKRASAASPLGSLDASWIAADLDVVGRSLEIPLVSEAFDAILASLVLSYLERPNLALEEAFRLLRPGGRIVISSLIKDADISRLYVESVTELQLSNTAKQLPELDQIPLEEVARNFLNDASRIIDLEAEGSFVFWEPEQLSQLLRAAGFIQLETRISFGNPGQAAVVSGYRPRSLTPRQMPPMDS